MQKIKKEAAPIDTSNSELRIRNVNPEIKAELREIMKATKKPFESYAIEHLITNYRKDQEAIRQMDKEILSLENKLLQLQGREREVLSLLKAFLVNTTRYNKLISGESLKLIKQFKGTLSRRSPGKARKAQGKSVPGKKKAPDKRKGGRK